MSLNWQIVRSLDKALSGGPLEHTVRKVGETALTPAAIDEFASLVRWYDFSDDANLTLVVAAISGATDLSGNAANLTQGTAANRPTRVTGGSGIGGLNAGSFDGGDFLGGTDAVFGGVTAQDEPFSFVMVAKPTTVDATAHFLWTLYETIGGSFPYIGANFLNTGWRLSKRDNIPTSASVISDEAPVDDAVVILAGSSNGQDFTLRINQAATSLNNDAINVGIQNIENFSLGGFANVVGANGFFGLIGEFALYHEELSNTNLDRLALGLNSKWTVY